MYERILVPVDGSATSNRGLAEALAVASKFGSRLRLLHVVDDGTLTATAGALASNIGELLSVLAEGGEKVLSDAKREAQARGVNAETVLHHSFSGRVCDVVVKEAIDWKADLIVIGTHGRRGAGRLLLGSDAEQVLRLAPVPVLLVRAVAAPLGSL
ncbi:MAG TPA: universal stress protein [Burkholderiaceae bacterium]|nr:universal stress protein [Burkholderiaceae bacterium]